MISLAILAGYEAAKRVGALRVDSAADVGKGASLAAQGVPEKTVVVDPSIARGLDYYTGTIYETVLDISETCLPTLLVRKDYSFQNLYPE